MTPNIKTFKMQEEILMRVLIILSPKQNIYLYKLYIFLILLKSKNYYDNLEVNVKFNINEWCICYC